MDTLNIAKATAIIKTMHKLAESLFLTSGIMTLNLPFDSLLANSSWNHWAFQQPSEDTRDEGLNKTAGNPVSV